MTSAELLAEFRTFARDRGWSLDEYNWKDIDDGCEEYTIWLTPVADRGTDE